MFAMTVQTVLLIATAFILGCVAGCLLRKFSGSAKAGSQTNDRTATVARSASTATGTSPTQEPQSVPRPINTTPVGPAAIPGKRDNLKRIKGIGPQNEARLNEIGVLTFQQIANWSAEDQRTMGDVLAVPGRVEREEWVAQAALLAGGATRTSSGRVASSSVTTSVAAASESGPGAKPEALLLDAPRDGKGDILSRIGGVGGVIETKLARLGIFHFDQIAAMSADEVRWLDTTLGFPGRAERENWQGDAQILAQGGTLDGADKAVKGEMVTIRKA